MGPQHRRFRFFEGDHRAPDPRAVTRWAPLNRRNPGGTSKAKRSSGCRKAAAAHQALLGVVAVEQAVDLVEVEVAPGHRIGDGLGAGLLDRPGDAVGGARVGLQDVEPVGLARLAAQFGFELAVRPQPAQEARHGGPGRSRRAPCSAPRANRIRTPVRASRSAARLPPPRRRGRSPARGRAAAPGPGRSRWRPRSDRSARRNGARSHGRSRVPARRRPRPRYRPRPAGRR